MNVAVLVATYGDPSWQELAKRCAWPSTLALETTPGLSFSTTHLHVQHATLAETRNMLAADARADWLCFVDADDRLDSRYLVEMYAASLASPAALELRALLVPAVQYVTPDGGCVGAPSIPAWGRALIDLNCGVIGTLVPRDLFLQVGGFPERACYEDWEAWIACVCEGAELVPVPAAVYCATARADGRNAQDHSTLMATYNDIRAKWWGCASVHRPVPR